MNTFARGEYRIECLVSVVGWSFFPLPPAPPILPGGGQMEKMPGLVKGIWSVSVLEVFYRLLIL